MSEWLIDLLQRLAPRERWLLGLLVLVVLPAALVLGWLWPLQEERRAAEARLAEVRALEAWVAERQTEMSRLASSRTADGIPPPIGASALEQSLISRKLRPFLSGLETRGGGEIALRFDEVEFTALMRWMDREDPAWGYRITALRIDRAARPAYVEARLTLVPAAAE